MANRVILVLVGLGIAAASSWFVLGSGEVVRWNDKIVPMAEQFTAHTREFASSIKPWSDGQRMDIGSFKVIDDALDVLGKKTKETAQQIRALAPPDDPLCKDFHASMVEFAEFQVATLADWGQIVDLMRKYNQPSQAERQEILDRLKPLIVKNDDLVKRLILKQDKMAKKFKIRMLNRQPG